MKIDTTGLVKYIREYVHGAGRKKGVVGLSGGIDSAVIAALAVEALDKENVIGITMPYDTQDTIIPLKLATNLDIPCALFNITDMVDYAFGQFNRQRACPHYEGWNNVTNLLKGNLMARQRAAALYMYAESHEALVIGTTNRTEAIIGYYTKYGDGAVDFEPLIEYWKTEVRQIGLQFDTIPQAIHDAPSTAGLWEGQTDEEELGVTYEVLDHFLQKWSDPHILIDLGGHSHPKFIWTDGTGIEILFPHMTIIQANNILDLIEATEHKRHMPPGYRRIK